jgi:hypothetical protein
MLPYTVLLGFVLLYWMVVAIGAIDIDFLDFSIDLEAGDGLDMSDVVDVSMGGGDHGLFGMFLAFLNIGQVPAAVIGTMVIMKMWMFGMAYHIWIEPELNLDIPLWGTWLMVFVVVCFSSLMLTGLTARPLRGMFEADKLKTSASAVGKTCEVITTKVTDSFGQGELLRNGAAWVINIVCAEPNAVRKGDTVNILNYNQDNDTYTIEKPTEKGETE